jgi:predicted GIY-YIG superfamily endonuclease
MTKKLKCDGETVLYRHFDKDSALLYVGVSMSGMRRLSEHRDHSPWFRDIARVEMEYFSTRAEALEAERKAIIAEKPRHNIHHKQKVWIKSAPQKIAAIVNRYEESAHVLVGKIVDVKPIYTFKEMSDALHLNRGMLEQYVLEGQLNPIELPPLRELSSRGTPCKTRRLFTGWQLLDFMQHLQVEAERKAA